MLVYSHCWGCTAMEDIQVNAYNFIIFKYLAMFWLTYTYPESAEKEIEMKQNEVYGINTRPLWGVATENQIGMLIIIAIMYKSDSKILATY